MINENAVFDPKVVTTFALSLIAYQGTIKNVTKQEDLKKLVEKCLDDFRPYIGDLEIQWGPFTFKYLIAADIMIFIVKDNASPPNYYVVIRGANLNQLCFTQAVLIYDIFSIVEWSKVPHPGIFENDSAPHPPPHEGHETRKIYSGLNRAMDILINKLDTSGTPTILHFLENITRSGSPIYFTGHSFGGMLASTFALYLKDTSPELPKPPEIYAYTYASPSAGNKDFAKYSNKTLSVNCKSITNILDTAYHLWNEEDLIDLFNLYKPYIPNSLWKMLFSLAKIAAKGKEFTQIHHMFVPSRIVDLCLDIELLCKKTDKSGYQAQMYYQHHIPYMAYIFQDKINDGFISLLDSIDFIQEFKRKEASFGCPIRDLKDYLNLLLIHPKT